MFSHLRNWFTLCLSPKYMYIGYNQLTIEFFSIPLKYSACMHFLNIFFTCRLVLLPVNMIGLLLPKDRFPM